MPVVAETKAERFVYKLYTDPLNTLPEGYPAQNLIVPASEIIHKFRAMRPGQPVGIPEAFCVINLITDFTDLHIMEMGASKLAAEIATVEINPSGEKSTNMSRSSRLGINGVNSAGNTTSKNVLVDYNVTLGAKNIAMRSGDSLQKDRKSVV